MSTHNIRFHAEIKKYQYILVETSALSGAMLFLCCREVGSSGAGAGAKSVIPVQGRSSIP